MPSEAAVRKRSAAPDRGMLVLEQKLSMLAGGPGRTRRNPALDVLTGRTPDDRLTLLQGSLLGGRPVTAATSEAPQLITRHRVEPTAMTLPVAAVRMAAVARARRTAPSPWLQASSGNRPRLKLMAPPPSRMARVRWLNGLLVWIRTTAALGALCQPYLR